MWPFSRRRKVTSEQFASALLETIRRQAPGFLLELQQFAEGRWPDLDPKETIILSTEAMIAYLWMASRVFSREKKMLNAMHDAHFAAIFHSGATREEKGKLANTAQAELTERYAIYYQAWPDMNPEHGKQYMAAVSLDMGNAFFPRRKSGLDIMLQMTITAEIGIFFQNTQKLREALEIVDRD